MFHQVILDFPTSLDFSSGVNERVCNEVKQNIARRSFKWHYIMAPFNFATANNSFPFVCICVCVWRPQIANCCIYAAAAIAWHNNNPLSGNAVVNSTCWCHNTFEVCAEQNKLDG